MLLEQWLQIDSKNKKEIQAMMPKRVKRRKEIVKQNEAAAENQEEEAADKEGAVDPEEEAGWEEYYDYVFPDEAST